MVATQDGTAVVEPAAPVPDPAPAPVPDKATSINLVDIENLLKMFPNLRQEFNPKTLPFWAFLSGLVAVVFGYMNLDNSLTAAAQAAVMSIGGLVVGVVTYHAGASVPVATAITKAKAASSAGVRRFGFVAPEGYYAPGTPGGSVLAPGADPVVAPPAGGSTGSGNVSDAFTDEGNVLAPGGTTPVQQGTYPNANAEPYSPLAPTSVLPGAVGNNSNEGTGGPAVVVTQGAYPVTTGTLPRGSYVAPTPNAANPDEANPHIFHLKPLAKMRKDDMEAELAVHRRALEASEKANIRIG